MPNRSVHARGAVPARRRWHRLSAVTASVAMILAGVSAPAEATQRAQPEQPPPGTTQALRDLVAAGIPGVIVHIRDGDREWDLASGVADVVSRRKARVDDRVRIGSVTKTFVATVLLQLEGEGQLSLDETVDRWLPGVVRGNGNDGRKITIRMLLNHSSGVPEYLADGVVLRSYFATGDYDRVWSVRRLVEHAMTMPPAFAPGTDALYSNTNYLLAGMIIEAATGRTVQEEVTRRIIRPLGLDRTSFPKNDPSIHGSHLEGYVSNPYTDYQKITRFSPSSAGAAGAIISTPEEVARFHHALFTGRLLRPEQMAELTTVAQSTSRPQIRNGLGFMQVELCGQETWAKDGQFPGYASESFTSRDGARQVVYAVNGVGLKEENAKAAQQAVEDLKEAIFCS